MHGLEGVGNRVREDYLANKATVAWSSSAVAVGKRAPKGVSTTAWNSSVAAVGSAPATGGAALFTDDFNRANGALTAPWVNFDGVHSIVSNKVGVGTGSPTISRYNQTFAADQWSEVDIDGLGVGTPYSCVGPAVRINNGDFYYLWHRDGKIQIWKRIGGNYSMVSEGGTSIVPGPLKARLEVVGTTLTAYVNGVAQTSGTATELATGQPGFISSDGGSATVDNFHGGDMPYKVS